MASPLVWGPVGWRAMFDLARRVDVRIAKLDEEALECAKSMQKLIVILSFCWPCDACSYFGTEYTVACPPGLMMFSDYLFDMKGTVDAKIKTIKYNKCSLEECVAPHISRKEFYDRQSADQIEDVFPMSAWVKLFVLTARHGMSSDDGKLVFLALNEALSIVCQLSNTRPFEHIDSLDVAIREFSRPETVAQTGMDAPKLAAWVERVYLYE